MIYESSIKCHPWPQGWTIGGIDFPPFSFSPHSPHYWRAYYKTRSKYLDRDPRALGIAECLDTILVATDLVAANIYALKKGVTYWDGARWRPVPERAAAFAQRLSTLARRHHGGRVRFEYSPYQEGGYSGASRVTYPGWRAIP